MGDHSTEVLLSTGIAFHSGNHISYFRIGIFSNFMFMEYEPVCYLLEFVFNFFYKLSIQSLLLNQSDKKTLFSEHFFIVIVFPEI